MMRVAGHHFHKLGMQPRVLPLDGQHLIRKHQQPEKCTPYISLLIAQEGNQNVVAHGGRGNGRGHNESRTPSDSGTKEKGQEKEQPTETRTCRGCLQKGHLWITVRIRFHQAKEQHSLRLEMMKMKAFMTHAS